MSTLDDSGYAPRKESLAGFGPTNTMAGFTGAKGLSGFDMHTNEPRRDERQRDTWLEATRPHMPGAGEGDGGGVNGFGAHPFKVINASDENGPKVRVLPGACNFTFPTVDGSTNEYWTPTDHINNAPRLDVSGFTDGCFIVMEFSPGTTIFPDANIVASANGAPNMLPIAYVALSSGTPKRITGIRQLLYDFVGVTTLVYSTGTQYAISR